MRLGFERFFFFFLIIFFLIYLFFTLQYCIGLRMTPNFLILLTILIAEEMETQEKKNRGLKSRI